MKKEKRKRNNTINDLFSDRCPCTSSLPWGVINSEDALNDKQHHSQLLEIVNESKNI